MKGRQFKRVLAGASVTLLTALATQAFASGYRLEFQSVSTMADSGDAAVINDAGTNWYNSAGLVYLPQQVVFGAFDVYAPVTYTGSITAPNAVVPALGYTANGSASSHPNTVLPLVHYSIPFRNNMAFGVSVVPAWGLSEDYGDNSMMRYDLQRIYTRTIDVAPSLSMCISDNLSVGVGPNAHYMALQQTTAARAQISSTAPDSSTRVSAEDWAYGGHIGLLYRLNEHTRFGINYRSKIVMHMKGYSYVALYGIGQGETNQFNLRLILPPTTTVSAYHDINQRWAVMGSVAYDQWSAASNMYAQNYMTSPTTLVNVPLPKHYSNTFDFSIGSHYRYNDKLTFSGSMKYEQTPTNNSARNIDFPDSEKLGVQVGARYAVNAKVMVDAIYGHVFTRTQSINVVMPVTNVTANGHTSTSVDFFGAQVVWNI